jgi:hypothetical protein
MLALAMVAYTLTGCGPHHSYYVMFDERISPEAVVRTFLRCGIHDDPQLGPGSNTWLIPTDVGRSKLNCLRHQPHVEAVRAGM